MPGIPAAAVEGIRRSRILANGLVLFLSCPIIGAFVVTGTE